MSTRGPATSDERWIRVRVLLPEPLEAAEAAEDLLSGWLPDLGAQGLEFEDPPRAVVGTFRAPSADVLVAQVVEALAETTLSALQVEAEVIPEDAWAPHWDASFEPLRFGPIAIAPSWAEVPDDAEHVLRIDPSQAFGTGLHPTTALCLRWLVAHPPRSPVLDVGTGSGVLALSALRLGAPQAVATDIDPRALAAARAAAELNGLSDRLEVSDHPLDDLQGRFQLVLANLRPDPLVALAPALAARLAPDGQLVISGLRPGEEPPVRDAFAAAGLEIVEEAEQEAWLQYVLRPS